MIKKLSLLFYQCKYHDVLKNAENALNVNLSQLIWTVKIMFLNKNWLRCPIKIRIEFFCATVSN